MQWAQENIGIVITVVLGVIGIAATIFYAANRNKVVVKAKGDGAKAEYTGGNKTTTGDGSPVFNNTGPATMTTANNSPAINTTGPTTITNTFITKDGEKGEEGKKKARQ